MMIDELPCNGLILFPVRYDIMAGSGYAITVPACPFSPSNALSREVMIALSPP